MKADVRIGFRTTQVNKELFQECAKKKDKNLSQWIVDILCAEARKEQNNNLEEN